MSYSPKFERALIFATRLHIDQVRKKSDTPYIMHLLAVASIVADYGGDEEQVIAGLLHDSVEDQGGRPTLNTVRGRFGPRVARIVEACTDSFETPKPPWQERKRAYVEHVKGAREDELLVSAADKLHNARSIVAEQRRVGNRAFQRFNARRVDVLWYYSALVRAFAKRNRTPLVDELDRTVREMRRLARRGAAAPRL